MEKRFRISLDFKVKVNEITKESAERELKRYSNYKELVKEPQTWEAVERQKRLLKAVLANKSLLKNYLARIVASEIESLSGSSLAEAIGIEGDEDKILKRALENLDKEDATFFREAKRKGLFAENAEHFFESFQVELEKAKLAEL